MKTVTAKDVAKRAGVSQSTVSRVYFEGASVSERSRKKVLAAAEELGYRPNEWARSLITSRSKIIGVVMKSVDNPFYPNALARFTSAFKEHGYSVLFIYTQNDEVQQEDIDALINYNVAGVVVTDASLSLAAAEDLRKYQIPLVLFNRTLDQAPFYSVSCDNERASRSIAEYLVQSGCERFAFITGDDSASTSWEREAGFGAFLKRQGLTYEKETGHYTYDGGYRAMAAMIERGYVPDGCFAVTDLMAFGAIDALRDRGISVPDAVRIIGFDNLELADWSAYGLTTWNHPIDAMVKKAVDYLLAEAESYTGKTEKVMLEGEFVRRKTA